jgi:hypothetical protein
VYDSDDLVMNARTSILLAALVVAATAGCSRSSPLLVRDGAVEGTSQPGNDAPGGATAQTGGSLGADGVTAETGTFAGGGGAVGTGGLWGSGGWLGSGAVIGSGGLPANGGTVGSGGAVGGGGRVGSGGSQASGGIDGGGVDGGGFGDCLGPSPLGAGVAGGVCEGAIRCINESSATLGYDTCNWLVTAGRASVFEAVRACFGKNPNFCSEQPGSVEACTGPIFAQACVGPGATVNGTKVDCRSLAEDCAAVSERECHLLTDVLNDKYYQAAFECYFGQSVRPPDCGTALRRCTRAPALGTGGASGTGGAGGRGGAGGATVDGAAQPTCPDLAGTWSVQASCQGPGAFFNGTFAAVMTQTGCKLTFTQTDDQTAKQWVATGTIDSAGKGSLVGDFGFTDSGMCDVEATGDAWQGRCGSATQSCQLTAWKQPDAPAACTGPLEDRWGLCPATFDGHPETFGCESGAPGVVRAAVIDGRQVIEWSSFPTLVRCVYASVNNGAALVGEIDFADSLLFCDRTSYSQAFGSVPDCGAQSCDLADVCTPSSCTCSRDAGADASPAALAADGGVGVLASRAYGYGLTIR